jgi:hypothetical protein
MTITEFDIRRHKWTLADQHVVLRRPLRKSDVICIARRTLRRLVTAAAAVGVIVFWVNR